MRDIREGVCPVCKHNEIIEGAPRVALGVAANATLLLCSEFHGFGAHELFGQLAAYTCRSCGFTQLYASKPAEVPIGKTHETKLIVGARSEQPFR